jgi:ATP-dependent DNA ligase
MLHVRTRRPLGHIPPCQPLRAVRRLGEGDIVFKYACKLGCEGIVSKRVGSLYRSGRSPHWLKVKNPKAPAVTREAEEDWGR